MITHVYLLSSMPVVIHWSWIWWCMLTCLSVQMNLHAYIMVSYFEYIIIVLTWYPMKSLDQGLFEMIFSKVCIPNENGVWRRRLAMFHAYDCIIWSVHYHVIYVLHLRGSYAMTWSMRKCILYHYISCYVHHYVSILFSSWVWINWGIKWCPVKPRAPVNGVDKIQVDD